MAEELDRMISIIKDYKSGYGGVTDGFMRSELEMFAKDYAEEQVEKALDEVEKSLDILIKEPLWEDEKVYKGKQEQRNKTQEVITKLRNHE